MKPPTALQGQPRIAATALGPAEYVDVGNVTGGPVVVAIHGAMGGWDQSAILADTVLDAGYRVIAVSRPGYLNTPFPAGSQGAAAAQQADWLAALLDALGIEHAVIAAISGGGPCAWNFALRHPARCRALALYSTVSAINRYPIPFRFTVMKLVARLPFLVAAMRKQALADLERTLGRSVAQPEQRARILADGECRALVEALMASTFDRMALRMPGTVNDIRVTQNTEYPLERIAAPTLIVHGAADPLVDCATHARAAARRLPNAELLTLADAGHMAIFTHRAEVRERTRGFLATHGLA